MSSWYFNDRKCENAEKCARICDEFRWVRVNTNFTKTFYYRSKRNRMRSRGVIHARMPRFRASRDEYD